MPWALAKKDMQPKGVTNAYVQGVLEWIAIAKKSETRARRVEETARLAEDNIRANQWRR